MKLTLKKLHPLAIIPTYATEGSARFDLSVTGGGIIKPGQAKTFGTGLAVEVPSGWELQIVGRSGMGARSGIRLANILGIIDADYRGEILICLRNDGQMPYPVEPGQRVAQAKLAPAPRVELVEVEGLTETERGAGGMGSTGA